MKVYVIQTGCRHEGGSVYEVHKTRESALKSIKEYMDKSDQENQLSARDNPEFWSRNSENWLEESLL